MTKRPDDLNPAPPGGRAAKRLQMFEDARAPKTPTKPTVPPNKTTDTVPKPPESKKKKR